MSPKIPFLKLWTEGATENLAVNRSLSRVVASGNFILGNEVAAFEQEFSDFLGVGDGVGVGSGTDAVTLALLAGNIGPGDEVIVPAFAPGATITGVLAAGARPILAEVDLNYGLDLDQLEASVSPTTRALMVVHLYGRPDAMAPILIFAKAHNLWVVEDCAQAHGASYWCPAEKRWRLVGTMGDVGAFSFYPTKNLGAIGDGGFCCAANPETMHKLRALRQYGWRQKDDSFTVGRNSRLDEIQAAVLRVALPYLEGWNRRRRFLAAYYLEALRAGSPHGCVFPTLVEADRSHVFHLFVLRTTQRSKIIQALDEAGIGFGVHYPRALCQQDAYRQYSCGRAFPVAEQLAEEVLSLPLYPNLREDMAARTAEVFIQASKNL